MVCLVKQGERGLQAFRVISMDTSTAVHPAEMQEQRTHVVVTAESGLERALVKWFNRTRASASLPAARALRTSSSTWRRCAATA